MRRLAVFLLPAALFCGQPRYARLGDFEGKVEVQIEAAEPWRPALRNLPLPESAWVRSGPGGRAEIELDDETVVRIGPDSLLELSDYRQLSTGQRITLVSLDHGTGYLTGEAKGQDALLVAVPGAQVTIQEGARIRLDVPDEYSQISVIEGRVQFSSPAAEMDISEGQAVRVEPGHDNRFFLYNEIGSRPTDRWSEDRDRLQAASSSASHVPRLHYGLADLDAGGSWIDTGELGTVWKPKTQEGWVPFRNGKWIWYDPLGYTWVSADSWGWLPYHYGRWTRSASLGWVWVPGSGAIFEPGDVYWLNGSGFAGWGPLAPGENWTRGAIPELYLKSDTTFARFAVDAREIDPANRPSMPREPLTVAKFVAALPSPPFPATRLAAVRPVLRAGSTRIVPYLEGVTYPQGGPSAAGAPVGSPPPEPPETADSPVPQPPPIVEVPPSPEPAEVYYPVPVYTGVVVVNPPDRDRDHRRPRPKPDPKPEPNPPQQQTPRVPRTAEPVRRSASEQKPAPTPAPAPPPAAKPAPAPPPAAKAPSAPVPRSAAPVGRGDRAPESKKSE